MARKTYEPEETGEVLGDAAPAEAKPMPEAEVTAPAKKNADKRCEAGFWCYIGPALPGLIQHGAIFQGDREKALQGAAEAIKKRPVVKSLIVSGDSLPLDRLKAKTPGTALYENCRKAAGKL